MDEKRTGQEQLGARRERKHAGNETRRDNNTNPDRERAVTGIDRGTDEQR